MTNQSKPGWLLRVKEKLKCNWLLWVLGGFAVLFFAVALAFYYLKFNISPMFCNYSTWEDFINNSHKNSFILDNFLAKLSNDPATWGTFGDYLGGTLNPIISFLALIGLLYTIHQQAQEMQATREELKQAAEQQRQQVEQQSRQSEIFNLQQFESTFFSLLDQHNKIIEKIITPIEDKTGYSNYEISITQSVISSLNNGYQPPPIDPLTYNNYDIISNYYIANKIRLNHELRRYFIILFQILKFISLNLSNDRNENKIKNLEIFATNNQESRKYLSEKNIDPREKIYSNIVRASIPNEILQLLALNCLTMDKCSSTQGFETFYNFQGLLNRYNFLEHLRLDQTNIVCLESLKSDILWLFLAINIEDIKAAFGDSNILEQIYNFFTNIPRNRKTINTDIEVTISGLEYIKNKYEKREEKINEIDNSIILLQKMKVFLQHPEDQLN